MADTSARWQISEPSADRHDAADVPLYVRNVVAALEGKGVMFGQGTLATRPAFGTQGRIYLATDQSPQTMYYDTGSAWVQVGALASGGVGSTQLADDSVTLAKMADNSVGSNEIIDGSVGSAELADGSVTAVDLANALKPSAGAGGSVEALRALGTGTGQAATGSHHTQHEAGGADQINVTPAMLDSTAAALLPQTGDIKAVAWDVVAGTNEPAGWLLCDGRSVAKATYPALATRLGTVWGAGDANNFVLPDFRGRSLMGKGTGPSLTLRNVGSVLGAEYITLNANQIPSHSHGISDPGHSHGGSTNTVGDHLHQSPVQSGVYGEFVVVGQTGDNGTNNATQRWGTDSSPNSIQRGVSGTTYAGGHGHSISTTAVGTGISVVAAGGGLQHDNVHPAAVVSYLVKT